MEEKLFFESEDGLQLCGKYRQAEDSKGCVLLVHGLNMDKDEWKGFYQRLADVLAETGFSSLRFDFRSHGESEGRQEEMTVEGEILDLKAATCEVLGRGYETFILLGSSFGAVPSIYYASQNPDRVRSLVLVSPLLDMQQNYVDSGFLESHEDELEKKGFVDREDGFRFGVDLAEEVRSLKPFEKLQELELPVLTFQGTEDRFVSHEVASKYGSPNDRSEFVGFEDAGHGLKHVNEEFGEKTRKNWEKLEEKLVQWCKEHFQV